MAGDESSAGPVRPLVALAFATTAFVALLIFGLGMLSLLLGEDVIAARGLGQIAGIVATASAVAAFAAGLWTAVRPQHPSYWSALWISALVFLAYLGGMWLGAVVSGADPAAATGVVGRIATTWFGVVIAGVGLVCAWGGIALVRTTAERPRWPWEDDEEP
jgi:hypothetical protein